MNNLFLSLSLPYQTKETIYYYARERVFIGVSGLSLSLLQIFFQQKK